MLVKQAFRFELDPNQGQRVALAKHVGAARFAYNWGLARCLFALEKGERIPSAIELHKEWNRWKRQHAPWWVEVSKCAPQEALRDLERVFQSWRQGRARRPNFKRKKVLDDNTAYVSADAGVQGQVVRCHPHSGGSVVPLHQEVLSLWSRWKESFSLPEDF